MGSNAEPFAEEIQQKIFKQATHVGEQKNYFTYHTALILQLADAQELSEADKKHMEIAEQRLQLALSEWESQMVNLYRESKRKLLNS